MFQTGVRKLTYKRNTNYEERRSIRAVVVEQKRRESRQRHYASNRNIEEDLIKPLTGCLSKNKDAKVMRLMLWKQEKERQRLAELQKKAKEKPPFKCGVVHHKLTLDFPSLPNLRRSNRNKNVAKPETTSFAPKQHVFMAPKNLFPIEIVPPKNKNSQEKTSKEKFSQKLPQDVSSCDSHNPIAIQVNVTKNAAKDTLETNLPNKRVTRSFARQSEIQPRRSSRNSNKPVTHPENPKRKKVDNANASVLPSISVDLSSVEEVLDERQDNDVTTPLSFIYPVNLSPWISVTRGSGKKKRLSCIKTPDAVRATGSLQKQIGIKLIEKMMSNPEEIEREEKKFWASNKDLADFQEEKDPNVEQFRNLYSEEMKRLGGICLEWDALLTSQEIPLESQDSIRTTVGQTRLLMREKLAQFRRLLDECASCTASKQVGNNMVRPSDLQGFWDLVSIQVSDVDNKFSKLKTLRDNNWIEPSPIQDESEKRKLRVRNVIKNPIKKSKRSTEKKSGFQLYLQEQKKKKQEMNEIENLPTVNVRAPSDLDDTPVKSILKSGKCRNLSVTSDQGETSHMDVTPRRVTFKGTLGEEGNHGFKVRVTPHVSSLKGRSNLSSPSSRMIQSPKGQTPVPQGDFISWESPYQDLLTVQKSRRSNHKN